MTDLLAERAKRISDAMDLRQPDRVPISLSLGMLLTKIEGVTPQELYENADAQGRALEKALLRFQPDAYHIMRASPGPSLALGELMTRWPGHQLEPTDAFQYHEAEYMTADDYDAFLADPADWAIRTYLPRVYTELQGLAKLPHLAVAALGHWSLNSFLSSFELPEVATAFEALAAAARLQASWSAKVNANVQRAASLGFPTLPFGGFVVHAPFDFMADTLRGTRGIFLDMRRAPDKLLAAEQKAIGIQLDYAVARTAATGVKRVFIPLHRGSDEFMSMQMFERFYWPQLKEMMVRLVDAGIGVHVFYEGCWDKRLHHLAELPKGKTVGRFQSSDIFKVKEVVGDTMCILGGMPVTRLIDTDPGQLRDYVHKVCEEVGRGGGFIMTTDIGEMESCNPDLVDVWIDAVKQSGQ